MLAARPGSHQHPIATGGGMELASSLPAGPHNFSGQPGPRDRRGTVSRTCPCGAAPAGSRHRDGSGSDPGWELCPRPAPCTLPRRQFQAGRWWCRGTRGHAGHRLCPRSFNQVGNIAAKSRVLRKPGTSRPPQLPEGIPAEAASEPRRAGGHGIPMPMASARSGGRSGRINAGSFEIRVPQ